MDWPSVIIAGASVIATLLGIGGMLGKKFDKIDARFDKMDARIDKIDARFDKIDRDIKNIDSRLSRMEGYIERDLVEKYRPYRPTGSEEK